MAQLQPIADALRESTDVDSEAMGVFVDALADSLLLGASLGAAAVIEWAQAQGLEIDVELDLAPDPNSELP